MPIRALINTMTGHRGLHLQTGQNQSVITKMLLQHQHYSIPSAGKSRCDIYYLTSNGHSIAYAFLKKFNFEHIIETEYLKKKQ